MLISISMTKQMRLTQFQDILKPTLKGRRVLNAQLIGNRGANETYVYLVADEDGYYDLRRAELSRKALTSNTYVLEKDSVIETGIETLWHAHQIIKRMRGVGVSLSGARPMASVSFPLSMIGLQASPNLEQVIYNWGLEQDIVPLRYAVYNPRSDAFELSLEVPNARNSGTRMRIIEQGLFSALKQYLDRHPEIGDYDHDKLDQLIDPNNLDRNPAPVESH